MIPLTTTENLIGINNDLKILYEMIQNRETPLLRDFSLSSIQSFILEGNKLILFVATIDEDYVYPKIHNIIIMSTKNKNNQVFIDRVLLPQVYTLPLSIRNKLSVLTNIVTYNMTNFAITKNNVSCSLYRKPFNKDSKIVYYNGQQIIKE